MLFTIILFLVSWAFYFAFADKRKFFRYASTCYVAIILGLITDLLIHLYPLWDYPSGSKGGHFFRHILDDTGVYFVVTYLFLQTLPAKKSLFKLARHIFFWSLFSISLEFFTVKIGFMEYHYWWNTGYSYLADWVLFAIFYVHYKWWESRSS